MNPFGRSIVGTSVRSVEIVTFVTFFRNIIRIGNIDKYAEIAIE